MWAPVFFLAFSGLIFFGIYGAIAGSIIGLLLRKTLLLQHGFAYDQQQSIDAVFFRTLFIVTGRLAKIDGRVNEQEIQRVTQLMNSMGLSPHQRQQAIDYFHQGKTGQTDIIETLNLFKNSVRSQNTIHLFIKILLQIAGADGSINTWEQKLLEDVCRFLGVNTFTLELLKNQARTESFFNQHSGYTYQRAYSRQAGSSYYAGDTLQEAYQVLGIKETTPYHEAKRVYRKLMSQNHPDKFAQQGVSEAEQRQAKQKTQAIQAAWNKVQQHLKSKA